MAKELMNIAEGETQVQVVAFKLRREEYGFNILNVKEIKGLTDITRVPFASDFIKGVINLRGSVLPVIDLKKRLGRRTWNIQMIRVSSSSARTILRLA